MKRMLFGFLGVMILAVSMWGLYALWQAERSALARDQKKTSYGMIGEDDPPPCTWELTEPERVLSENKTQAILIPVTNPHDIPCATELSFRAPGFDISPSREQQQISLPVKGTGSLSWIVAARRTGTYELAVADPFTSKIVGVTVTNAFGLNAWQAKLASIAGSIFGPMLTVPWWWDRLKGRKRHRQESRPEQEQTG